MILSVFPSSKHREIFGALFLLLLTQCTSVQSGAGGDDRAYTEFTLQDDELFLLLTTESLFEGLRYDEENLKCISKYVFLPIGTRSHTFTSFYRVVLLRELVNDRSVGGRWNRFSFGDCGIDPGLFCNFQFTKSFIRGCTKRRQLMCQYYFGGMRSQQSEPVAALIPFTEPSSSII